MTREVGCGWPGETGGSKFPKQRIPHRSAPRDRAGGGAGHRLPGERQGRGVGRVRGSRGRHLPGPFPPFSDPRIPEPESALGPRLASPEVAAPRTPARPLPPVQGDAPWLLPSPACPARDGGLGHPPPFPRPGDTCCDRPHLRGEPGRAGLRWGRAGLGAGAGGELRSASSGGGCSGLRPRQQLSH